MRNKIKSYHSPDVPNLDCWSPDDAKDVYLLVELEIGPADSEGADLFQVIVATPEGLRGREKPDSMIIEDRAVLVVKDCAWQDIAEHVRRIVESCESDTWANAAAKLQKFFQWEYEDYVEEVTN